MKKYLLSIMLIAVLSGCYYDAEDDLLEQSIPEPTAVETACTTNEMPTEVTEMTEKITEHFTEMCCTTAVIAERKNPEIPLVQSTQESSGATTPTASTTTESVTEPPPADPTEPAETMLFTEPELTETLPEPQLTDYEKACHVYKIMMETGHGTCVNYACQTYDLCREAGLACCLVWTAGGLYGHVANAVCVDGIWYIFDAQAGCFLDGNYGFTEVVDRDGNHVGDADMLSLYSYDEVNG